MALHVVIRRIGAATRPGAAITRRTASSLTHLDITKHAPRQKASPPRFLSRHCDPWVRKLCAHATTMHFVHACVCAAIQEIAEYRVESITPRTANVRSLGFRAVKQSEMLTFLPGQWVDSFIPGEKIVGGFSITSSVTAAAEGLLELTVKRTAHPPATWMAERAQIGDIVRFRVGGLMHWPPRNKMAKVRSKLFCKSLPGRQLRC